jgi:membrane-bound lytic murein transglycosylase B
MEVGGRLDEGRQGQAGGARWNCARGTMRLIAAGILSCAGVLCGAVEARADLLVFKTGKTMSVKATRVEGAIMTVVLRAGGEVSFTRDLIERVDPDEVPWPEDGAASVEAGSASREALPSAAPDYTAMFAGRPYAEMISVAATAHGVDLRLVHAVIEAESNYEARARSKKGAKGLMQLMPDTARQYAVKDPYDPKANIEAGVRHLKDLLSRFDVSLALAAYNAGEATIRRFGGVPPYAETKNYVARVLRRVGN